MYTNATRYSVQLTIHYVNKLQYLKIWNIFDTNYALRSTIHAIMYICILIFAKYILVHNKYLVISISVLLLLWYNHDDLRFENVLYNT